MLTAGTVQVGARQMWQYRNKKLRRRQYTVAYQSFFLLYIPFLSLPFRPVRLRGGVIRSAAAYISWLYIYVRPHFTVISSAAAYISPQSARLDMVSILT